MTEAIDLKSTVGALRRLLANEEDPSLQVEFEDIKIEIRLLESSKDGYKRVVEITGYDEET